MQLEIFLIRINLDILLVFNLQGKSLKSVSRRVVIISDGMLIRTKQTF